MKIILSERKLLGAVAKWAVEQSPYHRPDNLEVVLDKLHELTKGYFATFPMSYAEIDSQDVLKFVRDMLRQISEYTAWNDRKNGNDAPMKFTSRYDTDDNPDDDFIDLDALEMNVTNEITKE